MTIRWHLERRAGWFTRLGQTILTCQRGGIRNRIDTSLGGVQAIGGFALKAHRAAMRGPHMSSQQESASAILMGENLLTNKWWAARSLLSRRLSSFTSPPTTETTRNGLHWWA